MIKAADQAYYLLPEVTSLLPSSYLTSTPLLSSPSLALHLEVHIIIIRSFAHTYIIAARILKVT